MISSLLTVHFVISDAFLWSSTMWIMGFGLWLTFSSCGGFSSWLFTWSPPPRRFHWIVPFASRGTQAKASRLCLLCWSQFITRPCEMVRHPGTTISSHDFRSPRITGRSWASENVIVKINPYKSPPLPPKIITAINTGA